MTRPLATLRLGALALIFAAPLATPLAAQTIPGLDAAGMDLTVRPGDDFFRYANGAWVRNTTIPADRSSYGSFNIAAERASAAVNAVVHDATTAPAGTDLRRAGDFYTAFRDTAAIGALGLAPLRRDLDRVDAIDSRQALARTIGATLRADVDVINDAALHTSNVFGLWVDQDFDDPTRNSAALLQGGLGMQDRSYYLDPSPAMAAIRTAYRAHVGRMLTLAGRPDPEAAADLVVALETRIAQVHATQEDTWDPAKGNTHWSKEDFRTNAPGLGWDAFFDAAGLADVDTLVAWHPGAIAGIARLAAMTPLASWKALLAYHAIEHRAAVLPGAFDREAFAFFGHTLSGVPQQAARESRAVTAASTALGFAVGRAYVDRDFSPAAKTRAEAMVQGIVAAFDARIGALDWMAPETKAEARRKLQTLRVSVGYPDVWPTYDGLDIRPNDAYGNAERLERWEYAQALARLSRPTDRDAWSMVPQQVNAVNMPAMNALNFPAAILQPPFFDPDRSDAMNYAAIGAVIGHEISHSFDNLGAAFDADGRLRNWWTPDDFAHFTAATTQLAQQVDAYRPFPDLAVNGTLTLTENIADLAGVTAAYDAWRASLGGAEAPVVGGLTGDQQFFLSFAQVWRTAFRDAALRQRIATDGHAPGPYRALTVRNLDAWYAAFPAQAGDALYLAPADRVRIW